MKINIKLFFGIILSSLVCHGNHDTLSLPKPKEISIQEALKKKLLKLEITGIHRTEIALPIDNHDGIHYGNCMLMVLESLCDTPFKAMLGNGVQLIPDDSSKQTMIVTKAIPITVHPGEIFYGKFYAMCGQIHDDVPDRYSNYRVGEKADINICKLAEYFDRNFQQNIVGQHALWAYTDGASREELQKYGGDSNSLKLSKKILDDLCIFTKINPKPAAIKKPITPKSIKTKTGLNVERKLIYGAVALLFGLLSTTLYILFGRNKKKKIET